MDRIDELKQLESIERIDQRLSVSEWQTLQWAVAEIERLRTTLTNLCIDIETVVDHDDVTTKETWRAVKELTNAAMRGETGDGQD